jgi:hypothetical protein
MEMSPFLQRALRAGDRLRELMPDAGHHNPHADPYRRADAAITATSWSTTEKAIAVDRKYLAREGAMNVYSLYRTHNNHFAI